MYKMEKEEQTNMMDKIKLSISDVQRLFDIPYRMARGIVNSIRNKYQSFYEERKDVFLLNSISPNHLLEWTDIRVNKSDKENFLSTLNK